MGITPPCAPVLLEEAGVGLWEDCPIINSQRIRWPPALSRAIAGLQKATGAEETVAAVFPDKPSGWRFCHSPRPALMRTIHALEQSEPFPPLRYLCGAADQFSSPKQTLRSQHRQLRMAIARPQIDHSPQLDSCCAVQDGRSFPSGFRPKEIDARGRHIQVRQFSKNAGAYNYLNRLSDLKRI